jgi:hypothetical protein
MPTMVDIPAWCPNCNLRFTASNFLGSSASNMQIDMYGNTTSCPRCRRPARLMDGQYSVRDGVVEVITGAAWTRDRLADLQQALKWAADNFLTNREEAIRRVEVVSPEAGAVIQRIDPALVLTFLSLLVAVAAWLFPRAPASDSGTQPPLQPTPTQIIQIFNENPELRDIVGTSAPPAPTDVPKVHRNAPCPCGSGEKYRYCCRP